MTRTRKRPRRTPSATPRVDLSDWQGFRARRHSPRFRWLVIAAVVAVVTTILVAQFKAYVGEFVFRTWIFSLVVLQVVVVVESTRSEEDMRALFRDEVKPRLARRPEVGAYNQEI